MRVSKETRDYENSLEVTIKIKRIHGFDPWGYFEMEIKRGKEIYPGIINDWRVISILKNHKPYHGEPKFELQKPETVRKTNTPS